MEVELWSKPGDSQLKVEKGHLETYYCKVLQPYIFLHWSFYMNRLVGHHEAFADFSLGPWAHLRGSVLDFTNDEASGIPVRMRESKVGAKGVGE